MKQFLTTLIMFVLACNISVGSTSLKQVNDVEIIGSLDQIGQTAVVKHPQVRNAQKGDLVTIELAYIDGQGVEVYREVEYKGYVKRVSSERPARIECEDAIFQLKKKNINESWKETDLKTVVNEIIKDTEITLIGDLPEINFTKFRLENVNGAQALQQLKDEYGLMAYLRFNKLFVGLAYTEDIGSTAYQFGKNIAHSDLTFRTEDEQKIKVKVKSILRNNTIVEAEAGETDGAERTITVYNVTNKAQLKTIAEEEVKKLTYAGYEGSITGFLAPYATFGTVVELEDSNFPERNGKYIADKVRVTFGSNGARRKIELGRKV
jgi:hypothetical protein